MGCVYKLLHVFYISGARKDSPRVPKKWPLLRFHMQRTCLTAHTTEAIRWNGLMPGFLEPCKEWVEGEYWLWMNRAEIRVGTV